MHGKRWALVATLAVATVVFVALSAGSAFATAFPKGPYNTDDNHLHAKSLPAASYHTFTVDPYNESNSDYADWARISASATGTPFVIETLSSGAALTDTELFVYDSNGTTQLEENDDNEYWDYTLSSSIFFRAPHPGTFYIRLYDDDDQNGSCWLYINRGIARRVGSGSHATVAAAASRLVYSDTTNPEEGTDEGPDSVVVCNSAIPADVVAASTLATHLDTTVLFTNKTSLPSATKSEIDRLLMSYLWDDEYTTVYVIGGTGSVSNGVIASIAKLTNVVQVRRVKASNRAALAAYIANGGPAESWWTPSISSGRVILVNGSNVGEGALAATLAHDEWASVLMVNKTSMPAETGTFLTTNSPATVYIMGGTNSVSTAIETWLAAHLPAATVTRLRGTTSGGTLYDVAHYVADWGVSQSRFYRGSLILVGGGSVVDAAAAVQMSVQMGRPILFTPKTSYSSNVKNWIGNSADLDGVSYALGGTGAISTSTFDKFRLNYTANLP